MFRQNRIGLNSCQKILGKAELLAVGNMLIRFPLLNSQVNANMITSPATQGRQRELLGLNGSETASTAPIARLGVSPLGPL